MLTKKIKAGILLSAVLAVGQQAQAINNNVETTNPALAEGDSGGKFIPYGFYNADTGLALAAVWIGKGYIQDQVLSVANAWVGSNGSYQLFWANSDVLLPFSNRLFIDSVFMYSDWDEVDTYQNGNPNFPGEVAGSNDSDQDNFITATGDDLFGYLTLRYLLPVGDGRGDPIHTFKLKNGLPLPGSEAGGRDWNPLDSGRTTFELRPFYRDQDFEEEDSGEPFRNKTSGVKLALEYNNTDWYNNPTEGTIQRLTVARDWGLLDESSSWTSIQFRHSQFFNLGESNKARQRVLAFDIWTSDVPTWNSSHTSGDGEQIFHRAPLFEGSTLGGLERQRAYPSNRYHDRSAINYTAEYRYMPKWNPFPDIPLINTLHIPWWQWVAYAEVGRVADNWSFSDLHKKMKVSVGGSVRAMVYELVIRVDLGVSDEGGELQMFFNHPF
ncbi:MAG: BamA/TamA family outer membrane protein [Halioglobus sp.]